MMDKEDIKQDKTMIKKAFGMHDKQLHENKKTDLSKLKKGGSVKKMAKGGVTGKAMKAMGRNMARAMNQRSSGRGK
jgi:hypothetical protein